MSKTTDHIFTVDSFFDSFSLKHEYKILEREDIDLLYGYYTGEGEKLKNGEKGISIDKLYNKVTIVHCSGNDGSYTHTILTLGELEHLVNILK